MKPRDAISGTPGSGCDAIGGFNRMHAILGDLGTLHRHASFGHVRRAGGAGCDGSREWSKRRTHHSVRMSFIVCPGDTPHVETALQPDELITSIELPALPSRNNSRYRKVRDRASYAFALVSVAAALEIEDGEDPQRAAGAGRCRAQTVAGLSRRNSVLSGAEASAETFRRAADAELSDARGYRLQQFQNRARETNHRQRAERIGGSGGAQ